MVLKEKSNAEHRFSEMVNLFILSVCVNLAIKFFMVKLIEKTINQFSMKQS